MDIKQDINKTVVDPALIDLEQLDFTLSLTHEQRILYHQSALDLIFELRQARVSNETKSERSIESVPQFRY